MGESELRALVAASNERRQFGIRDGIAIVLRRWRLILGIAAPIITVAAIGTFRSSSTVTVSARVMIEAQQPESPDFNNLAPNWDMIMSTASQVAMSIPVADSAATAMLDTVQALAEKDPSFPRFINHGHLKRELLRGVDCGPVGESNILNIAFTHTNPAFCRLAVEAIMRSFINYSIAQLRNVQAIAYYDDQIAALSAEIDSLRAVRTSVAQQKGIISMEADASFGISQVRQLEVMLYSARTKREALETRLNEFRKAREANRDYVPTSPHEESAYLLGLRQQFETEKAQLAELKSRYQDSSEFVIRQERVVGLARQELEKELTNYEQNLGISLLEARRVESIYDQAVSQRSGILEAYPEVAQRLSSLDLQIDTRKDLLKALQFKRGEVRMKTGADARISSLVPLDEPSIGTRVSGSKKLLFLALASIFALALGIVTGVFVDSQDHRIYERGQVEHYLQIPVLGAVSLTEGAPKSHAGK